jgi:predicted aspartyl protease
MFDVPLKIFTVRLPFRSSKNPPDRWGNDRTDSNNRQIPRKRNLGPPGALAPFVNWHYPLDMGTFYTGCRIENVAERTRGAPIPKILVDTGSEYTWAPEATLDKLGIKREKKDLQFTMANGETVTRSVGFAIVRVDKYFTVDEVVFAQKGDLLLLGARSLEGLNLTVDPRKKKLVAAGPLLAA